MKYTHMKKDLNELVQSLVDFQTSKNLSQHQMAEKLNVCQTTYNNWINGKTNIGIRYYQSIGLLIGKDLNEIVPEGTEVTISMPHVNESYTLDANVLMHKLNHHLEQRLAYQIKENERLRREIADLKA